MIQFLLNASFTVTASILLVLLLKYALKKHTTPRWQFFIWIIPVVQLVLFPFSEILPKSSLSLRNYIPQAEMQEVGKTEKTRDSEFEFYGISSGLAGNTALSDLQEGAGQGNSFGGISENSAPLKTGEKNQNGQEMIFSEAGVQDKADREEMKVESFSPLQYSLSIELLSGRRLIFGAGVEKAASGIWLAGVLAIVFMQILQYFACRRMREKLLPCDNEEVLQIFEDCKTALRIQKKILLKTGAEQTMIVGIFRPVIYIKEDFHKDELKYVFMHELCHEKHKDVLFSLVAAVLMTIFWFNPVVWLAFWVFRRDLEVYCDDRAIKALGSRREYARVLVKSAAGKSGFIPVSTSFLGGDKEVTARVKRIAAFQEPRRIVTVLSLFLAVLVLAACTTGVDRNGLSFRNKMTSVALAFNWQLDIPQTWLSDMRISDGSEEDESGLPEYGKQFFDREGTLFAEVYYAGQDFLTEEEFMQASASSQYPSVTREQAEKGLVRHLEKRGFSNIKGMQIDLSEIEIEEFEEFFGFTAQKDGDFYEIVALQQNFFAAVMNTVNEAVSVEELISYLATCRSFDPNSTEAGTAFLENLSEFHMGNRDLTDAQYRTYAEKVFQKSFDDFITEDLPVQFKIKDFTLKSLTEVPPHGGSPDTSDIFLGAFCDEVRWDFIYPKAKVFRIQYEVTPYSAEHFVGEPKRERFALFIVNDYITGLSEKEKREPVGDFYFVGFLNENQLAVYGMDSVVLRQLENWYYNLNPQDPAYYHTDYIGNAPEVSRIVASLPLHEYIDTRNGTFSENALVLQTAEEPYSLTVNYSFSEKPENVSDEIALTPVDAESQAVLDLGINAYVGRQIFLNMNRMFSSIGNLGEIIINLNYPEDGEKIREVVHVTRQEYENGYQ